MISSIERTNLILMGIFLTASLLFRDLRVTAGVLFGGAIMALNFWFMRRILEKGFSEGKVKRSVAVKYAAKFLGLVGAVVVVVVFLREWVNILAFMAGLFTIFLAICIEGVKGYMRG